MQNTLRAGDPAVSAVVGQTGADQFSLTVAEFLLGGAFHMKDAVSNAALIEVGAGHSIYHFCQREEEECE